MNSTVIIIVSIFVFALFVWTIIRNQKDKKELEQKMNNDFPKLEDQKGEVNEDEL